MIPVSIIIKFLTIFVIGNVGFYILIISGCASSSVSEQSVAAQSGKTNTNAAGKQPEIKNLSEFGELCGYNKPGFDITPNKDNPDSRLYELINAGFPKEVSIDEAVTVFNEFARCDDKRTSQPPLTTDEVVAAIRDWDCTEEKGATDKKFCAEAWKIAETGKMPKGSLIDFDCGAAGICKVRGRKGYDVETWEIYLYVWLDKNRRDLKDIPEYSRLIRLKYVSSERARNQQ